MLVPGPHCLGLGIWAAPARRLGDPRQQLCAPEIWPRGRRRGWRCLPSTSKYRVWGAGIGEHQAGVPRPAKGLGGPTDRSPGSLASTRYGLAGDGGRDDLLENAVSSPHPTPPQEAELLSISLSASFLFFSPSFSPSPLFLSPPSLHVSPPTLSLPA